MKGKEKEIFRDCYNILESECGIEEFKKQSTVIAAKYDEVKDKMLCIELLGVIAAHIGRRDRVIEWCIFYNKR